MTKFSDRFLIVVFTLIIFLPGIGVFIKKNENEVRILLNREPYTFPKINIINLGRTDFKGIENWFSDHALFIVSLSKIASNALYKLGTSIKPGQAVIGKNDWLFLGNDYAATIDQFTGKNKPSKEEIYLQLSTLKQMELVAQEKNIPFIVLIAPDKQEIYSEYLPANIKKGVNKNRMELLEKEMTKQKIDFISLKPKEIQAKNTLAKQYGDLYLKGDSHWNYLGAYVAYKAVMNHLINKGLEITPLKFKFIPRLTTYSDLTNFLQLTHIESNNPLPSSPPLQMIGIDSKDVARPMSMFEGNPDLLNAPYQNINKGIKNKNTCLLIGDSFSESLSFYFYSNFYNTVRIHASNASWNLIDLIEKYHPDVIIYEKVERDLYYPLQNFQVNAAKVTFSLPEKKVPIKGELTTFKIKDNTVILDGWAYLPNYNAGLSQIYLQLTNNKSRLLFNMNLIRKQNFNLAFKHDGKYLNLSGFHGVIRSKDIAEGVYKISIIVKNNKIIGEKKLSKSYEIRFS